MTPNNNRSYELDKDFCSRTDNTNNQDVILTSAALEDKLVEAISSYNTYEIHENTIYIKWHYLDQAEALIYRINIYDPLPEFVIFTGDIPEWLLETLGRLGKKAMKKIVTNVIRKIYESVDPEYFHTNGIYGKVRWRFAS